MRTVVIEIPEQDVGKLGRYTAELSRDVESLEVLHHVKHGQGKSALICKIKPKEGSDVKRSNLSFKFRRFELLSEEKDGVVVYIEAGTSPMATELSNPPKVFLSFPFEVREVSRRVTFTGEESEMKKLFRWLERSRIEFKVISNSEARSYPNSFLDGLSEAQKDALVLAYVSGYYRVPRNVKIGELARRERVHKSTFAEHLMKAENMVISRVLAFEPKTVLDSVTV